MISQRALTLHSAASADSAAEVPVFVGSAILTRLGSGLVGDSQNRDPRENLLYCRSVAFKKFVMERMRRLFYFIRETATE